MTTSSTLRALKGADIFDGETMRKDAAVLIDADKVKAIVSSADIPAAAAVTNLDGGVIVPGYVDLQVNGGGGVMLNAAPTVKTLQTMADAHAGIGATTILPTLVTDTPDITGEAIRAVEDALASGIAGIGGIHLEGPHLAVSRKGAHDPDLIRPMNDRDLEMLVAAAERLPVLKVTVAPESVSREQIRALSKAGILVSLGHTDSSYAVCQESMEAGARCVTHLFNAQSQLGSRETGVVGAAVRLGGLSAGLIADGIHVHPAAMAIAMNGKAGPGRIFLVTDAMATAGTDLQGFTLNGREIRRDGNRLTLADGTLAGAHLDLTTAIRNVVRLCGTPLETALAMATSIPAALIGEDNQIGRLRPGVRADLVHLSADLELLSVFRGGEALEMAKD
ncbi:N-acetylglucosamine-6-phosphate deacetylase [Rhodobacterales bacterium]|nr:N-acetylglucosamine-6-phosphate deacetylase [Rhodobacterales bacterium]